MTARPERAVVIAAREQAALVDAPRDPAPLGPREVEGRTLATLISTGTELNAAYLGSHFPATPGYAAVFEVERAGAEASLTPGEVAFCMGPHRSWQRASADDALPVPPGLDPLWASFARLMNVAMSTLTTTTARPPQMVLVTGLGPVGHLAARVFMLCGYQVVACDPDPGRRTAAERAGLPRVLEGVPLRDPAVAGRVALALECSGTEAAALDCCRAVRKRGEVVLVGVPWRRGSDLSAHELLHAIFHHYAVVRSGWEWEVPRQPAEFVTGSMRENLAAALRWLCDGRVSVAQLYASARPDEIQAVYQALLHRTWPRPAAVIDWR